MTTNFFKQMNLSLGGLGSAFLEWGLASPCQHVLLIESHSVHNLARCREYRDVAKRTQMCDGDEAQGRGQKVRVEVSDDWSQQPQALQIREAGECGWLSKVPFLSSQGKTPQS